MNWEKFEELPSESRLWIHAFEKPLDRDQKQALQRMFDQFLPKWSSHGDPVKGAYTIVEDQFILIAGFCPSGISGCSADSVLQNFKLLRIQHQLDGLKEGLFFYRASDGRIVVQDRKGFRKALEDGQVSSETPVFDNLVNSLAKLREDKFERPFRKSWHATAFRLPKTADSR